MFIVFHRGRNRCCLIMFLAELIYLSTPTGTHRHYLTIQNRKKLVSVVQTLSHLPSHYIRFLFNRICHMQLWRSWGGVTSSLKHQHLFSCCCKMISKRTTLEGYNKYKLNLFSFWQLRSCCLKVMVHLLILCSFLVI